MSSQLPDKLLDKLATLDKTILSFWQHKQQSIRQFKHWFDLSVEPYVSIQVFPTLLKTIASGNVFCGREKFCGSECYERIVKHLGDYVKLVRELFPESNIRIFDDEYYADSWEGGFGSSEVVFMVEGKFALFFWEKGDW